MYVQEHLRFTLDLHWLLMMRRLPLTEYPALVQNRGWLLAATPLIPFTLAPTTWMLASPAQTSLKVSLSLKLPHFPEQ